MNDSMDAPPAGGLGSNRNTIIAIVVAVILLCCCCLGLVLAWAGWTYGDQILEELSRGLPLLLTL